MRQETWYALVRVGTSGSMVLAERGSVKTERLRSVPMKSKNTPGAADAPNEHRARLLHAMAHVAATQGFAASSIAAVVAEAGVSKRTFYEHFADKDACFLELYRAASASALRTLRDSVQSERPWQDQVEHALGAYLEHLSAGPQLIRMLFVEIHHLGPAGATVRREVMQHLADYMLETINASGVVLTPTMAMAAVGGIHELLLQAIEQGEAGQLQKLTPCAGEIVRVLTQAHHLQLAVWCHFADESGHLGGADVQCEDVMGFWFATHGVAPGTTPSGTAEGAGASGIKVFSVATAAASTLFQPTAKPLV